MAEKKTVQTTVRLDPEMLHEAKYYFSLEGLSLAKFVAQKVEEFVREYRTTHPERVPRGSEER